MYVRNDELFPSWYAPLVKRLSERTLDGVVFVGEEGNIRFLSDNIKKDFTPAGQQLGEPIDYFDFFFGLDLSDPGDLRRAERTPLYITLEAAKRERRGYATNRPWPVVLTPNGLAYIVETIVREIPNTGKYLAMELWTKNSDPKFWEGELRRRAPNIIKI